MAKKINMKKLKVFGMLVGFFLVVGLALSVITTVVAYPTDGHKRVATEFSEINNTAFRDGKFDVVNSPEYKQLAEHPNTKYSDTVNGIGAVVQLLIWVAMIVFAYRYLRKYRLVKHPVRTIAFAEAVGVALTVVPMDQFMTRYTGISMPFSADAFSLTIMLVSTTLISLFVTWLVAKIVEWQYNRSHGFIED